VSKKAIILLSGGLDSLTTLAIAKQQGFKCYALHVIYGQRHASETHAAKKKLQIFIKLNLLDRSILI